MDTIGIEGFRDRLAIGGCRDLRVTVECDWWRQSRHRCGRNCWRSVRTYSRTTITYTRINPTTPGMVILNINCFFRRLTFTWGGCDWGNGCGYDAVGIESSQLLHLHCSNRPNRRQICGLGHQGLLLDELDGRKQEVNPKLCTTGLWHIKLWLTSSPVQGLNMGY